MNKLAAELGKLDQSSGKTAGLKHVTDDMKSKNAPVKDSKVPAASGGKKEEPKPSKQVFELQGGTKWIVEGQTGMIEIKADQLSTKHSVQIFNCVGATIVVDGKCNTIAIDKCKKTQVLFQEVLATCEVVNCQSVKVQCKGKAPTVSIDKTDGCTVYLSRETMHETKVVASKSSEMNLSAPGATDDDAWIEKVIPEQYVHQFKPDGSVSVDVSDLYGH